MSEGDTDSSNDFSGREVDEDSGSDKENDDYESTVEPELDAGNETDNESPHSDSGSPIPQEEGHTSLLGKYTRKFSTTQIALLSYYFENGMRGVGKKYSVIINRAASETHLSTDQVKRWIKKRSFRRKHAKPSPDEQRPVKKVNITAWQQFLKEFKDTEDGKTALSISASHFNKVASNAYKGISDEYKQHLTESSGPRIQQMSRKSIMKCGEKAFKKIQKEFDKLDHLGYSGIGFGFFEEDVHCVGTPKASTVLSDPRLVEYLHSIIIANNPPPPVANSTSECPEQEVSSTATSRVAEEARAKRIKGVSKHEASRAKVGSNTNASPVATRQSAVLKRAKGISKTKASPMATCQSPVLKRAKKTKASPIGTHKSTALKRLKGISKSMASPVATRKSTALKRLKRISKSKASTSKSTVKETKDTSETNVATRKLTAKIPKGTASRKIATAHSRISLVKSQLSMISNDSQGGENDNSNNSDTFMNLQDTLATCTSTINKTECTNLSISIADPEIPETEPSSSKNLTSESLWISSLGLYQNDREVLLSDRWLNDNIVYATEKLLSQQTKGANIYGWQSPQLVKTKFNVLPPKCKYIQVLNVHQSHWITISNINIHDDTSSDNSVSIYDSDFHARPSPSTRTQICSLVKPTSKVFKFDVLNTMAQPNAHDCGVFALACATDLAHGRDPVLSEWDLDNNSMRKHLVECLERGNISPFPVKKTRRIPLGSRVRRTIEDQIYCVCRLPNLNKDLAMIYCNVCREWHHEKCMDININDYSGKEKPWMCPNCVEFMDSLGQQDS